MLLTGSADGAFAVLVGMRLPNPKSADAAFKSVLIFIKAQILTGKRMAFTDAAYSTSAICIGAVFLNKRSTMQAFINMSAACKITGSLNRFVLAFLCCCRNDQLGNQQKQRNKKCYCSFHTVPFFLPIIVVWLVADKNTRFLKEKTPPSMFVDHLPLRFG